MIYAADSSGFDKSGKSCIFVQQSGKTHTKPQTFKVRG